MTKWEKLIDFNDENVIMPLYLLTYKSSNQVIRKYILIKEIEFFISHHFLGHYLGESGATWRRDTLAKAFFNGFQKREFYKNLRSPYINAPSFNCHPDLSLFEWLCFFLPVSSIHSSRKLTHPTLIFICSTSRSSYSPCLLYLVVLGRALSGNEP